MARAHPEKQDRRTFYPPVINKNGRWNSRIELIPDALTDPLHWRLPQLVFVNSMSDLFHEDVPLWFIQEIFTVMQRCPQHTFQVLTKRSRRLTQLTDQLPWPPNVWMGVSVETEAYEFRLDHLRACDAAVKFASIEPLLGSVANVDLAGLNWVIVGGESGSGARPMDPLWVYQVLYRCQCLDIPFFFKQWGTLTNNPNPHDPTAKANGGTAKGGRQIDGYIFDQMPGPNITEVTRSPVYLREGERSVS